MNEIAFILVLIIIISIPIIIVTKAYCSHKWQYLQSETDWEAARILKEAGKMPINQKTKLPYRTLATMKECMYCRTKRCWYKNDWHTVAWFPVHGEKVDIE